VVSAHTGQEAGLGSVLDGAGASLRDLAWHPDHALSHDACFLNFPPKFLITRKAFSEHRGATDDPEVEPT
jgi:hypothetical protein